MRSIDMSHKSRDPKFAAESVIERVGRDEYGIPELDCVDHEIVDRNNLALKVYEVFRTDTYETVICFW